MDTSTTAKLRDAITRVTLYAAATGTLPMASTEREAHDIIYHDHRGDAAAARLMPYLERLAQSLTYTVKDTHLPNALLGSTTPALPGTPHLIELSDHLSPAGRFATLCHEVSHVLLNHVPRTDEQLQEQFRLRSFMQAIVGAPDNPYEEAQCELAAAAVCKLTHIRRDDYGYYSIGSMFGNRSVPEEDRAKALSAAETIWEAIAPGLKSTKAST